jgi:hypothetical protein
MKKSPSRRAVKKPRAFKRGDLVTVIRIPPGLKDVEDLQTKRVFRNALGKTYRVEGIGEFGHLELVVTKRDTIWIEPQFVVFGSGPTKTK